MAAYPQFAYACPPTVAPALTSASQLLSGGSPSSQTSSSSTCCESGRPIMTDPNTGQTICSCQYNSTAAMLSSYPRVPTALATAESIYGSAAYAAQGYMPFGTDPSAFYSPLTPGAYDLKDSSDAWRSLAHPTPCYPYDPAMAAGYPYGQSALAQRKNATREATSTLKAWLQEHIKNPYPTKGEKIMLAIITKMTLTQVSTWFANARRRLKKENKMTWSPRNRTDEDGNKIDSDDDDDDNKNDDIKPGTDSSKHEDDDDEIIDAGREVDPLNLCSGEEDSVNKLLSDPYRRPNNDSANKKEDRFSSSCGQPNSLPPTIVQSSSPLSIMSSGNTNCLSPALDVSSKPRIWSLADVATSSSSPPGIHMTRSPHIPPISPKLGEGHGFNPAVNSFRPWVNGTNIAAPTPYGNGPVTMGMGLPVRTQAQAPAGTGSSGLLRSYALAPRPEVH